MNTRTITAVGGFLLIVSVGGYFVIQALMNSKVYFDRSFAEPLVAVATAFLTGVATLMYGYLRSGQQSLVSISRQGGGDDDSLVSAKMELIEGQLKELTSRVDVSSASSTHNLTSEERVSLSTAIRKQIEGGVALDVLKELESKFDQQHQAANVLRDLDAQCRSTEQRLREEITSLTRRGNVNLIIGVLTTLTAVGLLASTVVFETTTHDPVQLATHFLPRLTLSLFIEFFSFFFLRLYSAGLSEIKYFQNELTNLESRFIALRRATIANEKTTLSKILQALALTERNFILKKGESTVDVERAKLEQQSSKDLISAISELVKQKK